MLSNKPSGLMIIRAWMEEDSIKPLRAQIRLTQNVAHGFSRELKLTDVESVSAGVEAWLREFLASKSQPSSSTRCLLTDGHPVLSKHVRHGRRNCLTK